MKRFKVQQACLAFMIFILSVFLITGCGSNGQTGHWSPARHLMSIRVTPVTASVPVTGSQQFEANAIYSDGSSIDVTASSAWSSDTPANASVGAATGLATGLVSGTSSVITATFEGNSGSSSTLTVNGATSVSFKVTPATASIPVTGIQQYTAIETFSDGSTFDRTVTSTWASSNAHATIGLHTGLATGVTSGTVVITATFAASPHSPATANLIVNAATSVSFVVSPATASVPVSGTQQYEAIETFSDGTTFNRTAASIWGTGTPAVATIDNLSGSPTKGRATGVATGTSTITATFGAQIATPATLTVTAAKSVSFKVTPLTASTPVGGTQQFAAIEEFSDGTFQDRTTTSAWSTSGTSSADASVGLNTGLATGVTVTPGVPVVINATFTPVVGPVLVATANLTVTAATLVSFEVIPATASVLVGGNKQYQAIETFSDGTTSDRTLDATWGTGTPLIASIGSHGLALGLFIGTSAITANIGAEIAEPAILTVSAALGPVNLGLAAPFAIVATAGVTNTPLMPLTVISGDAVLDPTSTCNAVSVLAAGTFGLCEGSPPDITGYMVISALYDPGSNMATIKADLLATFLSITPPAGPPAAGSLGGATNLPAGTTLGAPTATALVLGDNYFTPGVYQSLTSIMITGDLTLDALGDSGAIFVFQSSSTLGMAAATNANLRSRILLVGGAVASNVWWQVSTSATLGAYSEFQGNILAAASITMQTGATSCGRLLAGAYTAGAFVFDSNVVSVPGQPFVPPVGPIPAYSPTCD
jgi:hypothetical protein